MDTALKRATTVKDHLETKGYVFQGMNETDDGVVLAFLAEQDETTYVATILLSGNAVIITVFIESYGIDDFSSEEETVQTIPIFRDVWLKCASVVNPKMDGLCSIVVKSDNDLSMSVCGMTKWYYLDDIWTNGYIHKLFNQALVNTDAAKAVAQSLIDSLSEEDD